MTVIVCFSFLNKLKKTWLFDKTFLLADINIKIIVKIYFFIFFKELFILSEKTYLEKFYKCKALAYYSKSQTY